MSHRLQYYGNGNTDKTVSPVGGEIRGVDLIGIAIQRRDQIVTIR